MIVDESSEQLVITTDTLPAEFSDLTFVLPVSALNDGELNTGTAHFVGPGTPAEQIGLEPTVQELRDENEDLVQQVERLNSLLKDQQIAIAAAAHDLKSPSSRIIGLTEFILRSHSGSLDEQGQQFVNLIHASARRMHSLVTDVLGFTTMQEPDIRECDLKSILHNVSVDLGVDAIDPRPVIHSSDLPVVEADYGQLTRMLSNLIGNALKYRGAAPLEINLSTETHPDYWKVSVSDNGIGIPSDSLESIFDFTKRLHSYEDIEGQGIGLAACKKIAEMHGGKIWVESSVGVGSTFSFTLARSRHSLDEGC